jgi:glucose-1-phosphate adenylyltransferase
MSETTKIGNPRILAMVLAGGKGTRLSPLTRTRSKPAVPFAGKLRIVDFVLSNLVNSDIFSIYVLVQYRSQSLLEHLDSGWRIGGRLRRHFVTIVPPQMRHGDIWFRGTADAVYQNWPLVEDQAPDLVAVFGADHIYRMDIRDMARFHLERGAEATVAALPVPRELASGFGIIDADEEGRVRGFLEKPEDPPPMPGDPTRSYASMGNYLFDTELLARALEEDSRAGGARDFGRSVIPALVPEGKVYAYDFCSGAIPGLRPYEERGYWRDVGTLEAYHAAHMDLLGREPLLDLGNERWPIMGGRSDITASRYLGGDIENAIIAGGTVVEGGTIRNSVIGRLAVIEEGSVIEDSIVGDFCHIHSGARLRRAILDRHNEVPSGQVLDPAEPASREDLTHSEEGEGLVVLPRQPGPRA